MGLKEPFNAISHMVGGGLAVLAFPLLIWVADGWLAIAACIVYGTSLLAVFTTSALFHSIPHKRASAWLFRLDQSAIYMLIAGTYTPLALLLVGGGLGWTLLAIEWSLAIAGITILLTVHKAPQWIHQAAYIFLGWAAVLVLPRLQGLPWMALALIFAGGIAYTGGAVLYWRDRDGTWRIGDHGIWHLLVLGGAAAHVVFVLVYVL